MIFKNFSLIKRNKFLIPALIAISAVIVFCIGHFTVEKIQDSMFDDYTAFGELLAKSFVLQNKELFEQNSENIENNLDALLKDNEGISSVLIKDNKGNIIYSKKNKTLAEINVFVPPVFDENNNIQGTIELGLNAKSVNSIQNTAKNSIIIVFALFWIIFSVILILNSLYSTRELSVLYKGVKEIEEGKFGTKIINGEIKGEVGELFEAFNSMSLKLHNYEKQNIDSLTYEKNKLEAVLMSIANGVVVCDNFDKISLLNRASLDILNVKEEDILNTEIQGYCDSEGENSFKEKIEEFKNIPLDIMEKKPLEFKINIGQRVIKSLISPIYSKMHDYLGYIIILIDMTREDEVDRLKSEFISNVSHELRTPVTVLRTYADTLYNYGDEFKFEEQKEFIGTINQEVIRLNKMVNDVLDFSKFQSNELEKEIQDFSLIVEDVVESVKVLADEKSLKFQIEKEENMPDVPLNRESIERAIVNLITNAIKYSPEGSTIKIKMENSKKPDFIEFSVTDNGIGIAKEHLDKIFDRFYRIENSVHTVKGTGLGLNLVKVTVEKRHGGEVFVSSILNQGSTFGFRLPVHLVEENSEKGEETVEI